MYYSSILLCLELREKYATFVCSSNQIIKREPEGEEKNSFQILGCVQCSVLLLHFSSHLQIEIQKPGYRVHT